MAEPTQLDRIEAKLDKILKRYEDANEPAAAMRVVQTGKHELTPNDEELRRRIAARA